MTAASVNYSALGERRLWSAAHFRCPDIGCCVYEGLFGDAAISRRLGDFGQISVDCRKEFVHASAPCTGLRCAVTKSCASLRSVSEGSVSECRFGAGLDHLQLFVGLMSSLIEATRFAGWHLPFSLFVVARRTDLQSDAQSIGYFVPVIAEASCLRCNLLIHRPNRDEDRRPPLESQAR